MKAIRISEPGNLEFAEIPMPAIATPFEVLVKITAGSICGSDVGIFKGTNSLATYPAIIGHEYGGIVEKVGDLVTNVKPGDLVAMDPVRNCGHCYACTHGRPNVCRDVKVTGVHVAGGFAEYVVAPCERAHKVNPAKISPTLVSLVEPYSIGVEVNSRGQIGKADRVLVMGCGPAGICVMQDAKARGAEVTMSDIIDSRLEEARNMGADHTINVKTRDIRAEVDALTDGEGMSVVVDAACNRDSVPLALDLACAAGRVVILSLLSAPSDVAAVAITKKELDVYGSRLNNNRFPEVIDGMERGLYAPEKLRSHVFPWKDAKEAFDLVMTKPGEVRKVVLDFTK
jgi:L-gulonate 5-dehydrogenase